MVATILIAGARGISAADTAGHWVGTREIVHTSIGGTAVRIRLANTYGDEPLTLHSVYVDLEENGASVEAGSNHVVTFGGSPSVSIPAGALALSDAVEITVGSERNLAVSFVLQAAKDSLTVHASAMTTNYSGAADLAKEAANAGFSHTFFRGFI